MPSEQWYTNKQLFEQIMAIQNDFRDLRGDLKETRAIIKQYNGLRKEVGELQKQVNALQNQKTGARSVWEGIKEYSGWIVAMIFALWQIFQ